LSMQKAARNDTQPMTQRMGMPPLKIIHTKNPTSNAAYLRNMGKKHKTKNKNTRAVGGERLQAH